MMLPAGLGSPKGTGEGEDQHAVKAAGLLRSDIKEYMVKNGDIPLFGFSVWPATWREGGIL
jgi:hypothetical protein